MTTNRIISSKKKKIVSSALVSSKERFLHIELRCLCVKTISGIHSSNIQSLEVNRAGPHCNKVEVM